MTQEQENLMRDLKDMVNGHSKTINKMAKVINALKLQVDKLEVEKLKYNANIDFNDIFRKP